MREWHNKIKKLDLSKWIITKFYHYTSIAQDIFGEYDTIWNSKPVGDPYLKELYEHFLSIADLYYHQYKSSEHGTLHDNKVTIEITNIESGEKLYISSKDGRYLIGKDVWSEYGIYTSFGVVKYYEK